jgi:hypothetical protein
MADASRHLSQNLSRRRYAAMKSEWDDKRRQNLAEEAALRLRQRELRDEASARRALRRTQQLAASSILMM